MKKRAECGEMTLIAGAHQLCITCACVYVVYLHIHTEEHDVEERVPQCPIHILCIHTHMATYTYIHNNMMWKRGQNERKEA